MARLLAVVKSKGSLPLGSKCGNIEATFSAGRTMDVGTGTGWAGDRDTNAGNRRRVSGGNSANGGESKSRGSISISRKDGMRSGGSPALSGKSRGPAGIRSKKGRLK